MKKLDLNKKDSWREEIIWLRSPFVTCQYPEGFRWLINHPKARVENFGKERSDTFFRGSKSIKNRYRFCTIWLVGLEEEIIDKDFTRSYWLALAILGTTEPDIYRGCGTGIPRKNSLWALGRVNGAGQGRGESVSVDWLTKLSPGLPVSMPGIKGKPPSLYKIKPNSRPASI